MKDIRRARRVGIAAILFALALRLWTEGVPLTLARQLTQLKNVTSPTEPETGQNVRFSSSLEVFVPDFVETPPPLRPKPEVPPLPAFSGEEAVEVFYAAEKNPDLPALLAKPLSWDLTGTEPKVLILHTHSTESYTKNGESYRETSKWRTLDEHYNMLSVGAHLAEILARKGITAVQDRALHDYPSYNGSYVHARKSIQTYLEQYPTVELVLDLHRDASGGDDSQLRTRAVVDGDDSAQLMVVLGTNHEGYTENLSLGLKLHVWLEERYPGLMRPLQLRASRFNQDLSPGALLIEVGAAGNSHGEAIKAVEALGEAIAALGNGTT